MDRDAAHFLGDVLKLLDGARNNEIPLAEFEQRFLHLHAEMPLSTPEPSAVAIEDLFWSVEAFIAEPAIRTESDVDDDALLHAVEACLSRLKQGDRVRSQDLLEQSYPALWHFFGAYLHQDWREEYESTSAALRDFVSGTRDLAVELPHELQKVLTTTPDDALDDLIADLGCSFVPLRAGKDPRDWMQGLKDETQQLLQQPS